MTLIVYIFSYNDNDDSHFLFLLLIQSNLIQLNGDNNDDEKVNKSNCTNQTLSQDHGIIDDDDYQ